MNANLLVLDRPELLPAGVEFMRETPEMPETAYDLGGVACLASYENGSMDSDGTETTMSVDPGTMDPYTFDTEGDLSASSVISLN